MADALALKSRAARRRAARMIAQIRRLCLRVTLCSLLIVGGGCGPIWNPAGAKQIGYEEFGTIYYQTSKDRTKAFLFFSQPKSVLVGMSLSVRWDNEAEKYAVSFGGVKDTKGNRASLWSG